MIASLFLITDPLSFPLSSSPHSKLTLVNTMLAGTGKTYLASKVIDHFRDMYDETPNKEGFAFFYCSRNEDERRDPLSVLRSLVRQLSSPAKVWNLGTGRQMRPELRQLWQEAKEELADLSLEDCKHQIVASVNLYSRTVIVLDALDECDAIERDRLLDAIEELLLSASKPLKIFVSSRPDGDLKDRFADKPTIEIRARHNESDVQKYLEENIVRHRTWQNMDKLLQREILEVLVMRSEGM
jgi:Cdc6-like AAA superfamily ATPase